MHILIILIIAVSLSMDAFSLSLAYGTLKISNKNIYELAGIVGIYHFFMPLLGLLAGEIVLNILPIKPSTLVFIVLSFIGLEMLVESHNNNIEHVKYMNKKELLLFGFAVSLDSFSIGMSLNSITNYHLVSALLFALSSFMFTYIGLILGKKINNRIGNISTFTGGVILIIIGLFALIR